MSAAQERRQAPEIFEVHCDEGVDFVIAALRRLAPPYQVTIGIVTEKSTPNQRGLWGKWMDEIAMATGHTRREVERELLARYAPPHEYEFGDEVRTRPAAFAELSKGQASAVMTHVEVLAAEIGVTLSPGRARA